MWYALIDDQIVMNTAAGRRKHTNMLTRPAVSICVTDREKFVTVQGIAAITADDPALHRTIGLRYMEPAALENSFATQYDHQERITVTVSIDHIIAGLTG
jgi:hypothetical protein